MRDRMKKKKKQASSRLSPCPPSSPVLCQHVARSMIHRTCPRSSRCSPGFLANRTDDCLLNHMTRASGCIHLFLFVRTCFSLSTRREREAVIRPKQMTRSSNQTSGTKKSIGRVDDGLFFPRAARDSSRSLICSHMYRSDHVHRRIR